MRPPLKPARTDGRFGGQRGGFTLLEVLIAAMLLVVGMVGSIALILGLMQANRTARARDTGYYLAQQSLDEIGLVPLVGPTTAYLTGAFPIPGVAPSAPTCYPMTDDVISDRPISCTAAGITSAFIVRTWTCCNTGPIGTAATIPAATCGATQPLLTGPAATSSSGLPVVLQQSALCYVQAEVTWPAEDPVGHNLLSTTVAGQEALFQETEPSVLTFGNHVWATMVRGQ
jgi:Tfp pilus assembly protein PilV